MTYDDASWHYEGDFPKDLPNAAGATHIGMFVAWAFLTGLAGNIHLSGSPNEISKLRTRSVTPGGFVLDACDGKFADGDLNDIGNSFAEAYFDFETGNYVADYDAILGGDLPTLYHVEDSWESFDRLKPLLDRRFAEWRAK